MLGKLSCMNLLDKLARTDIDPALLAQVQALFAQQQAKVVEADDKLTRLHTVVAEKDFKIKALTFELAYYKRVRFGKASEALVGEQRLLFDETVDMDLAAIDEELRNEAPTKPPRKRAGRQPLPPELPRIEHRHEPDSCQCGQCGADLSRSARTSASNSTWNQRASSCIARGPVGQELPLARGSRFAGAGHALRIPFCAISVRSTPAVPARR